MTLAIGTAAPDFTLRNQYGQEVALAAFRGVRPVALVFFPLAFSGTCSGELCELRDNIALFQADGVELLGVSVDSHWSLRVWSEQEGFGFSLLSDFWPHGAIAQAYDAFLPERGFADRATYLIDTAGVIRAAFATSPGAARPLSAYREALAALRP